MQTKPSHSTTSSRTKNTAGRGGKRIATVERGFNRRRYAALLAEAAPRVITRGEELERVSRLVEPLLKKGESRTPEESALCDLLLKLIDDYQERHTIIPELAPHELLQALLEESGARQADLVPMFWLAQPRLGCRQRQAHYQQGASQTARLILSRLARCLHLSAISFCKVNFFVARSYSNER